MGLENFGDGPCMVVRGVSQLDSFATVCEQARKFGRPVWVKSMMLTCWDVVMQDAKFPNNFSACA